MIFFANKQVNSVFDKHDLVWFWHFRHETPTAKNLLSTEYRVMFLHSTRHKICHSSETFLPDKLGYWLTTEETKPTKANNTKTKLLY